MIDKILLVAFTLWVVFQTWRGFKDGLWLTLLSLLALGVAYASTLMFGPAVAEWLSGAMASLASKEGASAPYAMFFAYPSVFFVSHAVVRHVPVLIFPKLRQRTKPSAITGAALGSAVGVVSGLLALWFVTLLSGLNPALNPVEGPDSEETSVVSAANEALKSTAASMVALSAEVGASVAGMKQEQASAVSAMLKQPDVVIGGVQSILQSDEMRELLLSQQTRRMMALNDVNSLQHSDVFQRVMAQPAMASMTQSLLLEGKEKEDGERFIAEQITHIWRRFEYLKHDPRVKALLADSELQAVLKEDNPIALMTNVKFQRLAALIMDGTSDIQESQLNELLLASADQPVAQSVSQPPSEQDLTGLEEKQIEVKPYVPQTVYKWRDAAGKQHYSDWDSIPVDRRESAELMVR